MSQATMVRHLDHLRARAGATLCANLDAHGAPDWSTGATGHRIVRVQDDLLDTPDSRWFAEPAGNAEPGLLANSREVQARGVASGLGIAHLPRYLGDREAGLVRLETGAPLVRELWMGVHRDTRHPPRIVAVQDAIVDAIACSRDLLMPPQNARST